MTIGTMDGIASPGAQLDYYQSILEKMGRKNVDDFIRMYVVPHGNHSLFGESYSVTGDGRPTTVKDIPKPSYSDNVDLLVNWVEHKQAPNKTLVINENGRIRTDRNQKGYLLCSYPDYPKYIKGLTNMASSYISASPVQKQIK